MSAHLWRFVVRVRPRAGGSWVHSQVLPWELARRVAEGLRARDTRSEWTIEVAAVNKLRRRVQA